MISASATSDSGKPNGIGTAPVADAGTPGLTSGNESSSGTPRNGFVNVATGEVQTAEVCPVGVHACQVAIGKDEGYCRMLPG